MTCVLGPSMWAQASGDMVTIILGHNTGEKCLVRVCPQTVNLWPGCGPSIYLQFLASSKWAFKQALTDLRSCRQCEEMHLLFYNRATAIDDPFFPFFLWLKELASLIMYLIEGAVSLSRTDCNPSSVCCNLQELFHCTWSYRDKWRLVSMFAAC